jgi:hypothetical protein
MNIAKWPVTLPGDNWRRLTCEETYQPAVNRKVCAFEIDFFGHEWTKKHFVWLEIGTGRLDSDGVFHAFLDRLPIGRSAADGFAALPQVGVSQTLIEGGGRLVDGEQTKPWHRIHAIDRDAVFVGGGVSSEQFFEPMRRCTAGSTSTLSFPRNHHDEAPIARISGAFRFFSSSGIVSLGLLLNERSFLGTLRGSDSGTISTRHAESLFEDG